MSSLIDNNLGSLMQASFSEAALTTYMYLQHLYMIVVFRNMDFYFSSPFDLGGGDRNRSFDKLVSRLDLYTRAGSPHLDIGWYTFSLVVVFYVSNPLLYRTAHVSNSYKFNSFWSIYWC